jgi:hypothetical protein
MDFEIDLISRKSWELELIQSFNTMFRVQMRCLKFSDVTIVTQDDKNVMTKVTHKKLCYLPITPRLKRLFISKRIARYIGGTNKEYMRMMKSWCTLQIVRHERCSTDLMQTLHSDVRNIRFGLVTNDFDPFSTNSAPYSCWLIFAVSYNRPPSLCMKYEFMFLCPIVPSPEAPSPWLNVVSKLLIEELKQLWIGVEAYNCNEKQKFNLRAMYLWPVHDLKTYDIFVGWSVHEELIGIWLY